MTPGELCDRLIRDRSARSRIDEAFSQWWAAHDPLAHELVDELAARAGGESVALEALLGLVDTHGLARPALWNVLMSEHDVADAEQAALAVVALRVDQFDGRSRFMTWLHQVATNEARMLVRTRSRRPASAGDTPGVEAVFLARLSTVLADRDMIDRAVASLPEIHRELIELREVRGLEYDEIARTLDLAVGTVRSRLSRAREALITSLRTELDGLAEV